MSMPTDLRARLIADGVATTIRLNRGDQSDGATRIIIHTISSTHHHHMLAATGKAMARVQLDCYAPTPIATEALAEAVRQSIDGFRGLMGSTFVSTCHLESERTQYDPPHEGDHTEGGVDSIQLDYLIAWTLSVPTFS